MAIVPILSFRDARSCVIDQVARSRRAPSTEDVGLDCAAGRVLASAARADRNYPPLDRSVRDGFAVCAADTPGRLRVIGEVRAGEQFGGELDAGEAVEIMTGAPVPAGADAVVMVEHVTRDGEIVRVDRETKPGAFINPRGSEAAKDGVVLTAGVRLDYSAVAMLATIGETRIPVFRKPRVV